MSKQGASVLVIDDSPTVRRLVELILSQQGYRVHLAEDGERGLELARQIAPEVILVDYLMPKMNGHTFCKLLRQEEGLSEIPVILISSKGEVVGQAMQEEFGVLYYFSKPFEPDDLIDKLERVLKERSVPEMPASVDASPMFQGEMLEAIDERLDKIVRQYFQKDFPLLMKNVLSDTLRETGLVKSDSLIFSGDLSKVPLPDVLNFCYNSRLSGRLSVFSRKMFGEIFIDAGNFVFATVSQKDSHQFLTDLICRDGKMECDSNSMRNLVAEARSKNKPVGQVLVERGVVTEAELMEYLRRHAQDAFNRVIESASDGKFFLERDILPPSLQDIRFRIPLIGVLMDGLRLVDEKQLAATEFSDEQMVPIRLITNEDALESVKLNQKELAFFSIIDGKKTLGELIEISPLGAAEVKHICYALRKVGLMRGKND